MIRMTMEYKSKRCPDCGHIVVFEDGQLSEPCPCLMEEPEEENDSSDELKGD